MPYINKKTRNIIRDLKVCLYRMRPRSWLRLRAWQRWLIKQT